MMIRQWAHGGHFVFIFIPVGGNDDYFDGESRRPLCFVPLGKNKNKMPAVSPLSNHHSIMFFTAG